jgi:hypothetical protein
MFLLVTNNVTVVDWFENKIILAKIMLMSFDLMFVLSPYSGWFDKGVVLEYV